MFRSFQFPLLLALATVLSGATAAESTFEELKSKLPGQTVALRMPFKGTEIFFDLEGRPIPPYLKGTVGRDGFITVSEVRLDERNNVIITGHRASLVSFAADEPLHPMTAKDKGDSRVRDLLTIPEGHLASSRSSHSLPS